MLSDPPAAIEAVELMNENLLAMTPALTVAVEELLTRTGKATQAGQGMTMTASGRRQVSYDLAPEGWVRGLTGRDSLEMRVTVVATGQPIPVHWRTTFFARLRAPSGR